MSCKYQILTEEGFKDFDGVRRTYKPSSLTIKTIENSITCTHDHFLLSKEGWVKAQDLVVGSFIRSNGSFNEIQSITLSEGGYFFDPINVKDTHSYYASNILNHNCSFLGTGETFLDGDTIREISESVNNIYSTKYNNRMRVWERPEPFHNYILSVDVSLGRQRDYSAFHIINMYNGNQVAEFYSNKTSIDEFAKIIAKEGTLYNLAYVICERNTIGNNLIDKLFNTEEYENLWMDEKGDFGFQINVKNRETLLADLEEAIRNSYVKIRSSRTFDEFSTFIIKESGKVEAEKGHHDDLVMSLALGVHLYKQLFDTVQIEHISKIPHQEAPPKPSRSWKAPINTNGGITQEDYRWLIK